MKRNAELESRFAELERKLNRFLNSQESQTPTDMDDGNQSGDEQGSGQGKIRRSENIEDEFSLNLWSI